MKKIEFILFFGFCFLGISKAIYSQKQDTVVIKDSIAKMKLDKELIKLTKQVVLKHGPGYYREYTYYQVQASNKNLARSSPINFQEKRGTDILYRGVSL